MDFILTRPTSSVLSTSGSGTVGGLTQIQSAIPIQTTVVVDAFPVNSYGSAKWLISLHTSPTISKASAFELLTSFRINASPKFTKYAVCGDMIDCTVDVLLTSQQLQLSITNNELVDLVVSVTRIDISP